jgi:hypothetical protein
MIRSADLKAIVSAVPADAVAGTRYNAYSRTSLPDRLLIARSQIVPVIRSPIF